MERVKGSSAGGIPERSCRVRPRTHHDAVTPLCAQGATLPQRCAMLRKEGKNGRGMVRFHWPTLNPLIKTAEKPINGGLSGDDEHSKIEED